MHVITFLSLLTCLTASSTNNSTHLLATVLFYADGRGHKLVASGPIPDNVELQIKREISKHVKKAAVRVVPIYRNHADAPNPDDLLGYIKHTYDSIFITDLPEKVAHKIIIDEKYSKNKRLNIGELRAEVLRRMKVSTAKTQADILTTNPTTKVDTKTTPKKFPKTLKFKAFYAVESKCDNFEDECGHMPKEIYQLTTVTLSRFLRKIYKTSTTPYVPSNE